MNSPYFLVYFETFLFLFIKDLYYLEQQSIPSTGVSFTPVQSHYSNYDFTVSSHHCSSSFTETTLQSLPQRLLLYKFHQDPKTCVQKVRLYQPLSSYLLPTPCTSVFSIHTTFFMVTKIFDLNSNHTTTLSFSRLPYLSC